MLPRDFESLLERSQDSRLCTPGQSAEHMVMVSGLPNSRNGPVKAGLPAEICCSRSSRTHLFIQCVDIRGHPLTTTFLTFVLWQYSLQLVAPGAQPTQVTSLVSPLRKGWTTGSSLAIVWHLISCEGLTHSSCRPESRVGIRPTRELLASQSSQARYVDRHA